MGLTASQMVWIFLCNGLLSSVFFLSVAVIIIIIITTTTITTNNITYSVLRQVHSLFQSEFLVYSHQVVAYVFFLVFPSLLPFLE